jgi:hypothetical protein
LFVRKEIQLSGPVDWYSDTAFVLFVESVLSMSFIEMMPALGGVLRITTGQPSSPET